MAHTDLNLSGLTRDQILNIIHDSLQVGQEVLVDTPNFLNVIVNAFTPLSSYLFNRGFSAEKPLPATWDDLVADFNTYPGAVVDETPFFNKYRELLGMSPFVVVGPDGDTAGILDGSGVGVTSNQVVELMKHNLNHFLQNYPYKYNATGAPLPVTDSDFITNLTRFMTTTVVLKTTTTILGQTPLSYEAIFNAFFPGGQDSSGRSFEERAADFFKELIPITNGVLSSTALYLPSLSVDEWFRDLQEEFLADKGLAPAFNTSKSSEALRRTDIILRIFSLIVGLLTTIQQVAASQAERLRFLAQWQDAYTELLADVPVLAAGSNPLPFLSNPTQAQIEEIDKLNARNVSLSEIIRGRRGTVQDRAKALQSSVNQSNDAVTQQANMASSMIQELTTLLSAIYR